jgi:hypothetical protein
VGLSVLGPRRRPCAPLAGAPARSRYAHRPRARRRGPAQAAGLEAKAILELVEARAERVLSKVVHRYAVADLLVIDARTEHGSILVTTNLPFSEWTQVFPETRLCKAVVDPLTFNAHIIETGTESWRFKRSTARRKGGTKTA